MIGPRVGTAVGPRVGPAIGVGASEIGDSIPLILMFGDSQVVGEGTTDSADPAFSVTTTQPTTFVTFDKRFALASNDPITYQTDITGGVRPWAIGGTPGMGMEIAIGKVLTQLGIKCVFAQFAIFGMPLADAISSSTYPTLPPAGPNVNAQMIARVRSLEAANNATTKVAFIHLGGNDGANSTNANNVQTNTATLVAQLRATFPGIVVHVIVINADTINVGGGFAFIATAMAKQLAALAADPTIIPVYNDDRPLLSDHSHFTSDTSLTVGQRCAYLAADALGIARQRPAVFPAVLGFGPESAVGAANSSPAAWGGPLANDLEILTAMTLTASGVNNALVTPTSFTAWTAATYALGDRRDNVGNSYECTTAGNSVTGPTGTGTGIADGGTARWKYIGKGWTLIGTTTSVNGGATIRAGFYSRVVEAIMLANNHGFSAPTLVLAANSMEFSGIVTIRGPNPAQAPTVEASQLSANNAFNTGPFAMTGVSTLGANRTIVMITAGYRTNATANPIVITAPNLSNITVIRNGTRVIADAGCLDVQTGTLAAQGSTGNPSEVPALATLSVCAVLAVAP